VPASISFPGHERWVVLQHFGKVKVNRIASRTPGKAWKSRQFFQLSIRVPTVAGWVARSDVKLV